MDVNEEKNNKKLLWVGISFAAVTIVAITAIVAIFLSAPETKTANNDKNNQSSEQSQLEVSSIPQISEAAIERIEASDKASIFFVTDKINSSYIVEYRIQNATKDTLEDGILDKTSKVVTQVPLVNGDNEFIIKLRISNETSYSPWASMKVLNLTVNDLFEEAGTNTEAEPDSKYFDTSWAQEIGGEENLALAIKTAWGGEPVLATDTCMVLNSGDIKPGEMFPPMPSSKPDDYNLKYQAFINRDSIEVTYLWCILS